jgi:hypothetical protein
MADTDTSTAFADASTQRVMAENGIEYAEAHRHVQQRRCRQYLLFQHHSQFATDVHTFLDETTSGQAR